MSLAVWGLWGWCFAIVGAFLVGVGGLLATFGWNRIQAHNQWRNTIVGVVREVELNDRMIETDFSAMFLLVAFTRPPG